MHIPDIDIDTGNRDHLLKHFDFINAMRNDQGVCKKHNSGVYFQYIPHNPLTNLSTIPYKESEERGYFKIDILNVSLYSQIKNSAHLDKLINEEPVWDLLESKDFVDMLFHINGHYETVQLIKPKSIEDLAVVLALIRPSKSYLKKSSKVTIYERIWEKEDNDQYTFKKSHAISYALLIAVHINLIKEQSMSL